MWLINAHIGHQKPNRFNLNRTSYKSASSILTDLIITKARIAQLYIQCWIGRVITLLGDLIAPLPLSAASVGDDDNWTRQWLYARFAVGPISHHCIPALYCDRYPSGASSIAALHNIQRAILIYGGSISLRTVCYGELSCRRGTARRSKLVGILSPLLQRSLKVIEIAGVQQVTYHFLLVFRYRDIVSCLPTWSWTHPLPLG